MRAWGARQGRRETKGQFLRGPVDFSENGGASPQEALGARMAEPFPLTSPR